MFITTPARRSRENSMVWFGEIIINVSIIIITIIIINAVAVITVLNNDGVERRDAMPGVEQKLRAAAATASKART